MEEKDTLRIPKDGPAKVGETAPEVLAQLKAGQALEGDPPTPASTEVSPPREEVG